MKSLSLLFVSLFLAFVVTSSLNPQVYAIGAPAEEGESAGEAFGNLGDDLSFPYYSKNDGISACGSSGAIGSVALFGADNEEKVWNFLISQGLTPFQVAGIMGNLKAESGFDPSITEDGGDGLGIAQWSFGRRDALEAAARAAGVDLTQNNDANLSFQLQFLVNESKGRESITFDGVSEWEGLKRTTNHTSTDASVGSTTYWEANFERPAVAGQQIRIDFATAILAKYGSGDGAGGAGASGGSCSTAGSGELPTGTPKNLAQQILDSGKASFPANSDGYSYGDQIRAIANGNNSCQVDPQILSLILYMTQRFRVSITSINRFCSNVITASGTGSLHYAQGGGHAVDVNIVDGVHAYGPDGDEPATQKDIAFLNYIVPVIPRGGELGQVNCSRPQLQVPEGVSQVNDSCNHHHIGVPPQ